LGHCDARFTRPGHPCHLAQVADPKKRLPVLVNTPEEEQGEEPRPPWHWVGFGVAATFGASVPLQYVAESITQRILRAFIGEPESAAATEQALAALSSTERVKVWIAVIGIRALPLLLGALFGGWIVGRWGGDNAGVREGAIAGAATAIIVSVLAFASLGAGAWWTPLVLLATMTPLAWWGARIGLKKRIRMRTPNVG
jgi:hypothetical protein